MNSYSNNLLISTSNFSEKLSYFSFTLRRSPILVPISTSDLIIKFFNGPLFRQITHELSEFFANVQSKANSVHVLLLSIVKGGVFFTDFGKTEINIFANKK